MAEDGSFFGFRGFCYGYVLFENMVKFGSVSGDFGVRWWVFLWIR